MAIPPERVTTAMGFDGYRVAQHRGVVRGIVVRSRSVVGSLEVAPGVTEVLAYGTAVVIEPAGR